MKSNNGNLFLFSSSHQYHLNVWTYYLTTSYLCHTLWRENGIVHFIGLFEILDAKCYVTRQYATMSIYDRHLGNK